MNYYNSIQQTDHLNTLYRLIKKNNNDEDAFDLLYEKLELEYYTSKSKMVNTPYLDDLYLIMSTHAKRFIHRSSPGKFKVFVFYFLNAVEKELERHKGSNQTQKRKPQLNSILL